MSDQFTVMRTRGSGMSGVHATTLIKQRLNGVSTGAGRPALGALFGFRLVAVCFFMSGLAMAFQSTYSVISACDSKSAGAMALHNSSVLWIFGCVAVICQEADQHRGFYMPQRRRGPTHRLPLLLFVLGSNVGTDNFSALISASVQASWSISPWQSLLLNPFFTAFTDFLFLG